MSTRPAQLLVLLGVLPALLALPNLGCGRCSGAIRKMRAQHAEWLKRGRGRSGRPGGCKKGRGRGFRDPAKVVRIKPAESFRIRGDGPKRGSAELLELAGIGQSNWVLLDDLSGRRVPAVVWADAGGHMCFHGVGFNLRPRAPLKPGAYTLVLYLDQVRWPLAAVEERVTHEGRPAMVKRFVVE